jgi:hypothetical protein
MRRFTVCILLLTLVSVLVLPQVDLPNGVISRHKTHLSSLIRFQPGARVLQTAPGLLAEAFSSNHSSPIVLVFILRHDEARSVLSNYCILRC